MNNPAESLAVESEQHELSPILVTHCGGGDEDISLLRGRVLAVSRYFTRHFIRLRLELYRRIHFRPQVRIGFQNLNLDLHRRFLPIRFRRHFRDLAFVGAILERIQGDGALLFRRQFGKIILRDIELDLNVVQICEVHNRSARAAFGAAGELRGDQFAFLSGAFQNGAAHRGTDHRRVELRLGICHLAFGLQQVAAGTQ